MQHAKESSISFCIVGYTPGSNAGLDWQPIAPALEVK
jgi:hypothetical protein